jgi:biotin carboxyl carrier protein
VVASTDYMKAYAEQIRPFIPKGRTYKVLGTDGFGRSDFRSKLREHFEVNRHYIVVAALQGAGDDGTLPATKVAEAIKPSTASRPTRSTRCTPNNQRRQHMALVEIQVPDIGDFDEVAVIELLVKPGDTVKAEQSSSRSSPTRPRWRFRPATRAWSRNCGSSWATRSSEGSVVLVLEAAGAAAAPAAPVSEPKQAQPSVEGSPIATESVAPSAGPCCTAATGPVEVRVPDIGDFKDVAVIEVFVKPGDTVKLEQSLITVESDKASMEIPSPAAGVVKRAQGQARRHRQHRRSAGHSGRHRGGAVAPAVAATAPAPAATAAAAGSGCTGRAVRCCRARPPPHRRARWGCRTHRPRCASSPANWACR